MTPEEAGNYEMERGPHRDQTIAEIFDEDIEYFIYLRDSDLEKAKYEEPILAARAYAEVPRVAMILLKHE